LSHLCDNTSMEGKTIQVEFHKNHRGKELAREWLNALDKSARGIVLAHIARLRAGNLGKVRDLKGGLFELKIQYGPGYRLYFYKEGDKLVILLLGGDKGTQSSDIEKARRLLAEME